MDARSTFTSKNAINSKGYRIYSIAISTDGHSNICFDIEWQGDKALDYYEMRVFNGHDFCIESYAYASNPQKINIKSCYFDLVSGRVNNKTFYIELGIAEYDDKGEEKMWHRLAISKPISAKIYYKYRLFRKNILEIR